MKEASKEKVKKFLITFCVLVAIFLLTTLIGYVVEVKIIGELEYLYVDYLLYLLGYGSLDKVDVLFRLFFSIGSLLALTFFSSACTVSWLESRRILKIDNKIVISKNQVGEYVAKLRVGSKRRDIYGAKISLLVNIDGKSYSEETEIAYVPKKQFSDVVFSIKLNSVIYKYFYETYKGKSKVSELVATVKYSDMLSGTEFTSFEKFNCQNSNDFAFVEDVKNSENNHHKNEIEIEFLNFIKRNKFDVDFSNAQILDSKSPDRTLYSKVGAFTVDFNKRPDYDECDFQMLYVPVPEVTEWGVYHDMNCEFNIKLNITKDVTVAVQIKKNDGSILNFEDDDKLTADSAALKINLSNYRRTTWENIKELCFTVFYNAVKTTDKTAKVVVEECAFVQAND